MLQPAEFQVFQDTNNALEGDSTGPATLNASQQRCFKCGKLRDKSEYFTNANRSSLLREIANGAVKKDKPRTICIACSLKRKASASSVKKSKRSRASGSEDTIYSWEQVVGMIDDGYTAFTLQS